jgi:hypothetical protein
MTHVVDVKMQTPPIDAVVPTHIETATFALG